MFFDTCANCTIAPKKDAQELGLSIQAGTTATVSGVGGPQGTDGLTVFPSLVKTQMGGETVNANLTLKARVMPGMKDKVIACASQFITEFDGAALLVLDPEGKKWGGTMVMPHGAKMALSVNKGGMMVLGGDPALCEGGQVSVMLAIEQVCAELIHRETAGAGRTVKEIVPAVTGLLKDQPVRRRRRRMQPNSARRLSTASVASRAPPGAACSMTQQTPVVQRATATVMQVSWHRAVRHRRR